MCSLQMRTRSSVAGQKRYGSILGAIARDKRNEHSLDAICEFPCSGSACSGEERPDHLALVACLLALNYEAAVAQGVRGFAMWTVDAFHDGRSAKHNRAVAAALWGAVKFMNETS